MILRWLGKEFFGLSRGRWLLIALALLVIAWRLGSGLLDRTVETARDAGATEQREADLIETINRAEEGNAARDEIRNDVGSARYDQCVRSIRTAEARANCQRFLPGLQAPVR